MLGGRGVLDSVRCIVMMGMAFEGRMAREETRREELWWRRGEVDCFEALWYLWSMIPRVMMLYLERTELGMRQAHCV